MADDGKLTENTAASRKQQASRQHRISSYCHCDWTALTRLLRPDDQEGSNQYTLIATTIN